MAISDTNFFYYTFSTIAQVLAASLGLLGVFCLFKVENSTKQIIGWAEMFFIDIRGNKDLQAKINQKNSFYIQRLEKAIAKQYLPHLESALKDIVDVVDTPSFKKEFVVVKSKIKKQFAFVHETKICILISVIVTIVCLAILPYPFLQSSNALTACYIAASAAGLCLLWIGRILWNSLRQEKELDQESEFQK